MLIIDGYNLLWAAHKHPESSEITDLQLCYLIGRYLKILQRNGQIVFDGTGPPDKAPFGRIGNLEVIFSGQITDADTLIETKIAADTAPKRLMIVSSDIRIKKAAQRAKAESVNSEQFYSDMIRLLSQKRPPREPPEKKLGLDEAQTRKWLEYFGLEQ